MAEKNLDFELVIDRKNTHSLKYDMAHRLGKPEGILPLWVADMDFKTSSYIQEAIEKRVEHGVFGYSEVQEEYFDIVSSWMLKHHNWRVESQWLVKTPGVVYALAAAIRAFTNPGDSVLIQEPVYYPFRGMIEANDRRVVDSPLKQDGTGKYCMDYEDLEEKIVKEKVTLLLLCNPHNPVGRVWTREELECLGDICCRHQVIVVSDEIHADFIWKGRHQVFADLKEEYKRITVTCTSPSKTFNIAGLQISNIFISDAGLRRSFRKSLKATGQDEINVIGLTACMAAYRKGEEWYQAMLAYVRENILFVREYLEKNIPGVKLVEPEGTYLLWLDCRELGLDSHELEDLIVHKAGLWLDRGAMFGKNGEGFERINIACPRSLLEQAFSQLKKAVQDKESAI